MGGVTIDVGVIEKRDAGVNRGPHQGPDFGIGEGFDTHQPQNDVRNFDRRIQQGQCFRRSGLRLLASSVPALCTVIVLVLPGGN